MEFAEINCQKIQTRQWTIPSETFDLIVIGNRAQTDTIQSQMNLFVGNLVAALAILFGTYLAHRELKKPKSRSKRFARNGMILIWIIASLQVVILILNSIEAANNDREMTALRDDVKGVIDGGKSFAVVLVGGGGDATNLLGLSIKNEGDYPLRQVRVAVTDETMRIRGGRTNATMLASSRSVGDYHLGDIPAKGLTPLPSLQLDPGATNFVRFDINALNGFSWEIVRFFQRSNEWNMALVYRFRKVGTEVMIEPPSFKNALMVY